MQLEGGGGDIQQVIKNVRKGQRCINAVKKVNWYVI